jgi:two-component system sensor histidine kinase KdpD
MSLPAESPPQRRRGLSAPLALPAGFAALLVVGAVAAASHGAVSARWVLALAAVIVVAGSAVAELVAAPVLGAIGWLIVVGFAHAPYARLEPTGRLAGLAALVIAGCTTAGILIGLGVRHLATSVTLWVVEVSGEAGEVMGAPGQEVTVGQAAGAARGRRRLADLSGGIGGRRVLAGVLLVGGLPLLTVPLSAVHLDLGDDLLIYLVAVVAVAVVGGFWPAVLAAVIASLLVNWYFTPPVHTLTIADGKSLLALLLFITVAVTVSSVVHLAALRARQAARSTEEAADLLALAQTVLGGEDTPAAVLEHLTSSRGGHAELLERSGAQWVKVASSGAEPLSDRGQEVAGRPDLVLVVSGQRRALSPRLLDGLIAQAAAAQARDRLQPHAHGAARRGQPRPAHPARVDQGKREHAAADRRAVDRGGRGGAAGHDRGVC